jgi:hypothetical protein
MHNNPDHHPHRVSGARLTTTYPSPPDVTVSPSRPPPPSPPSSRRSRSSARPPSPASLPPPSSPRCVLDSTTISPAGASDRPYPRAREPTRGANEEQRRAETSSDVSSSLSSRPGRARAPAAPLAHAFPRAPRAVSTTLALVGGSKGHSCANLSMSRARPPPSPHRASIPDSTSPSLSSLILFSSPRTPSPTTSSRASPTSR